MEGTGTETIVEIGPESETVTGTDQLNAIIGALPHRETGGTGRDQGTEVAKTSLGGKRETIAGHGHGPGLLHADRVAVVAAETGEVADLARAVEGGSLRPIGDRVIAASVAAGVAV
mmetsp:Transcript_42419/g.66422  ORF Transcript_42419/g.66422 Transcript_42419/m.66422 type:complete len:116 (+) Transcript_42419:246-593(+)